MKLVTLINYIFCMFHSEIDNHRSRTVINYAYEAGFEGLRKEVMMKKHMSDVTSPEKGYCLTTNTFDALEITKYSNP